MLVDVKDVLSSKSYWYDYRQLYEAKREAVMAADGRVVERVGPASNRCCPPRHQSLARISDPCLLSQMASYDVARNIW